MAKKFKFEIPPKDKEKAILKGIKKGGREADIESGGGAYALKGGPHKNKKKYKRSEKHKKKNFED